MWTEHDIAGVVDRNGRVGYNLTRTDELLHHLVGAVDGLAGTVERAAGVDVGERLLHRLDALDETLGRIADALERVAPAEPARLRGVGGRS